MNVCSEPITLSTPKCNIADTDLVDECVFRANHSVMLTVRSCFFFRKKHRRIRSTAKFELSARTRARIQNAASLEQLHKNDHAFQSFSDCVASIQLLSCFKTHGDPEGAFNVASPSARVSFPGFIQLILSYFFSIPVMTLTKGISGLAFIAGCSNGALINTKDTTGVLWNSGILPIRI